MREREEEEEREKRRKDVVIDTKNSLQYLYEDYIASRIILKQFINLLLCV